MKFDDVLKALDRFKGDGTWAEIARRTGLHYDTVARIARGRLESPSVQNAERIAAALIELHPELLNDIDTPGAPAVPTGEAA